LFREIGAYNDFYNCMLNGHQEALNKIQEIGQDQINEHGIFIKFICKEKPTIGS
jgi:predicted nucleotidyltransferase